ncbi:2Fe-2S iron-sulfur cluster-binding protein [Emcibacter nanhaiensis]|uniref:2Fe-2S iron-sulfur cluster binding domain-containing protein n=1 Tax=Emcibacter nanhaiensis TaxID=1505037 RepID=A0A501PID7_9PROT|nr:2Fe-2S iron-sulfur cluster-binding protein [Emcibacter nanhaiensis]TPD59867.1 2Fe-2S iron-sulfur cluster binding domain-containing protein [Emcibacter nanhaiensis]
MPKITYIEYDGEEHVVEASEGSTVMQTAVDNGVPGIDGDCGGFCSCATCHVYVEPAWIDKVGPPNDDEAAMLDYAGNIRDNSRLGCQITITEELDGLVVRTPESQH